MGNSFLYNDNDNDNDTYRQKIVPSENWDGKINDGHDESSERPQGHSEVVNTLL